MKEIQLTQGQVAKVSNYWFEELNKYKWQAHYHPHTKTYYAIRSTKRILGKQKTIQMHRVIVNAPDDMQVDHIDRDTLNNQEENLRLCTNSKNQQNRGINSANTSGYKGVHKHRNKWQAQVTVNEKHVYRKSFSTPEEAARAYDEAAKKYFGEFANLNFKD